jgi:hypothetical protein
MADKKISELPLINTISGSIVFVPIVHDGITEKITVEDFSKFTNKYAAQTGSVNIFTANQTINANLSVNGNTTISSNATVGGNLVVNGKLTAQEVHTEITSASIIFESGSTIFGNSGDDTHQFTGVVSINGISIGAGVINEFTASQLANDTRMLYITGALNAFTASQIGKDGTLSQVTSSLGYFYQTTSSLHAFTSSQLANDIRMLYISGALNSFTASQIGKDVTLALVTSSLNDFTQSQIGKDVTLALVTSSYNAFTQSQIGKDGTLGLVTSSINDFTQSQIGKDGTLGLVTSSYNAFTQSQIGKDFTLSIVTSSLNNYTSSVIGQANTLSVFTSSINAFTGSQLGKDLTLSIVTSSIDAHILKQATQTGSQDLVNYNISVYTGSQNVINTSVDAHILKQATQTGSQDLVNLGISTFTGSLRSEVNLIEAYTSSLKAAISVNGSNVQIIGELNVNKLNVQYISSSVLLTSGSNIFGDQTSDKHEFTGSVNIKDTLFVNGQAIGLGELNAFTGSQIGKDFTLSVVTSSIDAHILKQATQTGSQDLVNLGISTYTGSQNVINNSVNSHILAQSTQTGSQDLVNLGISTFTGSLRSEVNLIEAYTASLKGAAIVSSSQQITNYYKFAETASANTFYGNQSITGALYVNDVASTLQIVGNGFGQSSLISPNGALVLTPGLYGVQINGTYPDLQANGNITANGSVTGNIIATNNVVSSSQQITNYYKFAETASANTFYGNQTINGYLTATGTITMNKTGGYGILAQDDGNNLAANGAYIGWTNIAANRYFIGQLDTSNDLNYHYFNGSTWATSIMKFTKAGGASFADNIVMASGKGIDFSATSNSAGTMTSELLNDYEEGTWTPTLTSDTSPSGVTYSGRVGKYTKIGRVVHIEFVIGLTSKGTGTGDVFISGLPFTVANDMASGEPACVGITLCQGLNTSVYLLSGFANNNSTDIQLRKTTAASTTFPGSYINTTDITDTLYIQGNLTYHV